MPFPYQHTVQPQLEPRWFVYHGLFELVLSPYEILPIAPENKYLRKFSYFILKLYVVCTH